MRRFIAKTLLFSFLILAPLSLASAEPIDYDDEGNPISTYAKKTKIFKLEIPKVACSILIHPTTTVYTAIPSITPPIVWSKDTSLSRASPV